MPTNIALRRVCLIVSRFVAACLFSRHWWSGTRPHLRTDLSRSEDIIINGQAGLWCDNETIRESKIIYKQTGTTASGHQWREYINIRYILQVANNCLLSGPLPASISLDVFWWRHPVASQTLCNFKGEWLSLLASTSKRDKCKYGGTSAHLLAVDECHEFPRIELIDGPQESNMVGIPLTESFASDDAFQTPPPQCGSVLRHGTSHQSH